MAWVKIDDQAPRHKKMLKAGPAACWMWVCGIAHSQSQLTDGVISDDVLAMIGIKGETRARKLAEQCVSAGLFDRVEHGYAVHDFLSMNPSKAAVVQKRAEDAERKRLAESKRTPRGIQADSGAPRAGVPSHPIPSHPVPTEPPHVDPFLDAAMTERAGNFIRRYRVLYPLNRNGARYIGNEHRDYQAAVLLCREWDDARLEKLAIVFLNSDHKFAEEGSRTIPQFKALASWCDGKLAEAESMGVRT